jgi:hypothetical protein
MEACAVQKNHTETSTQVRGTFLSTYELGALCKRSVLCSVVCLGQGTPGRNSSNIKQPRGAILPFSKYIYLF